MEPLNTLQKIKQHTTEGAALKTFGRRVPLIVRIPELKKIKETLKLPVPAALHCHTWE